MSTPTVDLDAYVRPPQAAATLAARREALLDQMGWLEDEAAVAHAPDTDPSEPLAQELR